MLVNIEMNAIYPAGGCHGAGIKEEAAEFRCNFPVSIRQSRIAGVAGREFQSDRASGVLHRRRGDRQNRGNWHSRFYRCLPDRRDQRGNALCGVQDIMRVYGLKIVGTEHQNDQGQRRVDFDLLRQTYEAVTPGLEGVLPHRAPPVKAVFYDPYRYTLGFQLVFHYPWPSRLESESLPSHRNDAPGKRIPVQKDLLHCSPRTGDH